eukprot:CAMPEP_0198316184 /NCGR_PEP_ID=MMETSP1450-20131203/6175_1 /TAXON_ID=753684 ORGANISM="Madagascaria erythrocladiodes, Strain CCMP3234" /NCGR_SAMPLE_ID=MMETSP1450 /ASSEMBLY_ACC=CAM_ASM_001115 /LENGTH=134 /DNA_ID=CAMNT_0044019331 /DNA_START=73 /DNA_END=474 /DNA_ORIENTATION=+
MAFVGATVWCMGPSGSESKACGRRRATAKLAGGVLGLLTGAMTVQAEPLADAEWQEKLTRAEYFVLRRAGTERPFTSTLLTENRAGNFCCAGCGAKLFSSAAKYDSGTGWPSFSAAIDKAEGGEAVLKPALKDW